jgi:GNAT superfamily N-acetyltransferase
MTTTGQHKPVHIERLGLDDLDLLLRWRETVLRDVFELPADTDLSSLMEANRAYYEDALASGTHIAGLAYLDGQAVGCGAICLQREMPSPENPSGRNAYLMNVYTMPSERGRGVASSVVAWLIQQADDAGAEKVFLEATPAAKDMYERAGFVELPGMMHLEPSDDR